MTTLSVAMATYNRARILPETLGYILGQSRPPDQIMVVDDGSSDATGDVLKSFGDAVTWVRQDNAGPGAALKRAIELCDGDWIALCDDDDKWHPDHLARRERLIERYPDADYTFSNFGSFGTGAIPGFNEFKNMPQAWWDGFQPVDEAGFQWLEGDLLSKFLSYNPVFPTSVAFRKSLYARSGGIDEKFSRLGCWDAHFTWRCVLHGAVACDHAVTVETRKHTHNFSSRRSRVNLERAAMLETVLEDGWMPERYLPQLKREIEASRITAARWAWHDADYGFLRHVVSQLPAGALPFGLGLRVALLRLPFIDLLRRSRKTR